MFNLVRRISNSFIPRPDRPWEDDPTSNAPAKRKKRRLSSTERHLPDETEQIRKKLRGDTATPDAEELSTAAAETQAVKDVTQGVKEVDLDDNAEKKGDQSTVTAPESIPLPEESSEELDEPATSESAAPPATAQSTADSSALSEDESEPVKPNEKDLPEPVAVVSSKEETSKLDEEDEKEQSAELESSGNDTSATAAEPAELSPSDESIGSKD